MIVFWFVAHNNTATGRTEQKQITDYSAFFLGAAAAGFLDANE